MNNNYKTVIDEFNNTVTVDYDNKKLYNYSNKDEIIYYNAEIIEDGKPTGFWTTFKEAGIVSDVEERLSTGNNAVKLAYAKVVGFNASDNDADRSIWKGIVELVKSKPECFFDENGDFIKELVINPADIVNGKQHAIR